LTQITDEFFFTAFNQIVKDLRNRTPPSCDQREQLRASKLVRHKPPPRGVLQPET
jgi:hypothetical protein